MIDGRPRQEALELVSASDASLVVLRDTPVFETVIPSKIFEAMALRRPIVLGVRGEARRIVVEEGDCGLAFPPEDAAEMVSCLRRLKGDPALGTKLGENGRRLVTTKYGRTALAERMLAALERAASPVRAADSRSHRL